MVAFAQYAEEQADSQPSQQPSKETNR
jgi:hypothetical protein